MNEVQFFNALQKLLLIVRKSESKLLLSYVCEILITSKYSTDSIELELYLKPYLLQIDLGNQAESLQTIFNMCTTRSDPISSLQRYSLVKTAMTVLVRHCLHDAFVKLYMNNMSNILEVLHMKITHNSTIPDIIDKTVMLVLVQSFFGKIKDSNIESNLAPFNTIVVNDDQKWLLKDLYKYVSQVGKENHTVTAEFKNSYRIYQCEAYNALASLLCSTQKESGMYCNLFGQQLWEKLIDVDKVYKFVVDFDMVPQRKKVLTNIRGNIGQERKQANLNSYNVHYMESQNLFNSTLSEDITKYDFTYSVLRSQATRAGEGVPEEDNGNAQIEISLESISINEHKCAGTVCGVIQHLVYSDISPLPDLEEDVKLPKWMATFLRTLESTSTHRNVKIFFTNVIYNCKNIFKHYARWFLAPIMQIIVDGCFGSDMNFFVVDLVSTVHY